MMNTLWRTAALTAVLTIAAMAQGAAAADRDHPAVVEEFQSQGCNSCPPANANLNAIADRPDVLALSFSVTYWDRLGWKDTFGKQAYTDRQYDYAKGSGRSNVYTPQMVVNGTGAIVGNVASDVDAALAKYDRGTGGPDIESDGRQVSISGQAGDKAAVVWMVRYDPRTLEVEIRAGENRGKTLPHRNVVMELAKLGDWQGGTARFDLPTQSVPTLETAVLVQAGTGGPILAAKVLDH